MKITYIIIGIVLFSSLVFADVTIGGRGSADKTVNLDSIPETDDTNATTACAGTEVLLGNGSCGTITALATPAGSNTEIQYNNGGAFGADNRLRWIGSELIVGNDSESKATIRFNVSGSDSAGRFTFYPDSIYSAPEAIGDTYDVFVFNDSHIQCGTHEPFNEHCLVESDKMMIVRAKNDAFGNASLKMTNRFGEAGAKYTTEDNNGVIDFIFKTSKFGQHNIRLEGRVAQSYTGQANEFQFGVNNTVGATAWFVSSIKGTTVRIGNFTVANDGVSNFTGEGFCENNFHYLDNIKTYYGNADDSSIYYDGNNLVINAREVGNGHLKVEDNTNITGNLSVGGFGEFYGQINKTKKSTDGGVRLGGFYDMGGPWGTACFESDLTELGGENTIWCIDNGGDNLRFYDPSTSDVSMRANETGWSVGDSSNIKHLSVSGNIEADGNITGNQIYGEAWYHNHTATQLNFATQYVNYSLWLSESNHLNGFTYTGGFKTGGNLTAQSSGLYRANWMAIGDGQNNHIYVVSIFVNSISRSSCEAHKKMSAGGDIVTMDGSCFVDLNASDVVELKVSDYSGTGIGNYYGGNLNLVRIGNG